MGPAVTRLLPAAFAVGVGLVMLVVARGFPSASQAGDPGTAAFPQIAGAGLVVLGTYQGFKRTSVDPFPRGVAIVRVAGVFAVLIAYSLIFPSLDFVIGGVLFVLAALLLAGEKSVVILASISIGTALLTAVILVSLADVPLPSGPIGEVLF